MNVVRTLKPGQPGTRRFQTHWGDKLVVVRYRQTSAKMYTTIEIIVDERTRQPPGVSLDGVLARQRASIVAVRINYEEGALREAAKRNKARWSRDHKVWLMPYEVAVVLGLQDRVIEGLAERCVEFELF